MNAFHGFYYTQKNDALHGLKLTTSQSDTMERIWQGPFSILPHEEYWKKLARYMMTHAPQGYVAWHGVPHWIIGNCGRIVGEGGGDNGVNVLQFHEDQTFAYQWYALPKSDEDDDIDPIYDLIFTPWDWLLDGDGDDDMFQLKPYVVSELQRLMAWTDAVHEALEKRWPSDEHWS